MRDIVLTLLIFGSIPAILVKPQIGVLVFSWISYMNPHRLSWGFAYDFRFAMIVGALTIFAWLIGRGAKRIPWSAPTLLLLVLTLWISVTTLFAMFPGPAAQSWEQIMKIMIFNGIVTLAVMNGRAWLDALVWVIVVSIGFFGVKGGLFTLTSGGNYLVLGPPDSFIADNNDLGLALLMVFPLMRYLQMVSASRLVRWGLGAAMFLNVVAIFGTYSRGALLGTVVMGAMLLLKTRRRFVVAIGLILTVWAGAAFMPEFWHYRMESIPEYQEDRSAQGRLQAWDYALDLALERPIVGGGFGAFHGNTVERGNPSSRRDAHSIYFQVLGEQGFVGLGLYLALGLATFAMGSSIARRTRQREDLRWAGNLARMLQVSLVAYAAAGTFLSRDFFDLAVHFVAITILVHAAVRQAVAAKAPEPVPAPAVQAAH